MSDRAPEDEPSSCAQDDLVMAMLGEHIPLALLMDLSDPDGPLSAQIFRAEGAPDTRWWEH